MFLIATIESILHIIIELLKLSRNRLFWSVVFVILANIIRYRFGLSSFYAISCLSVGLCFLIYYVVKEVLPKQNIKLFSMNLSKPVKFIVPLLIIFYFTLNAILLLRPDYILRFPMNTTGILIARFQGVHFEDCFGEESIEGHISRLLQNDLNEMQMRNLSPWKVRSIPFVVKNRQEAKKSLQHYRAKFILYGYSVRSQKTGSVWLYLIPNFLIQVDLGSRIDFFEIETDGVVNIDLNGDLSKNTKKIINTIDYYRCLYIGSACLRDGEYEKGAKYFQNIVDIGMTSYLEDLRLPIQEIAENSAGLGELSAVPEYLREQLRDSIKKRIRIIEKDLYSHLPVSLKSKNETVSDRLKYNLPEETNIDILQTTLRCKLELLSYYASIRPTNYAREEAARAEAEAAKAAKKAAREKKTE